MSIVRKCDICGNPFDYGFSIDVNIRRSGWGLIKVVDDMFEICQKNVCRECYYKAKKAITETIKSDTTATNGG